MYPTTLKNIFLSLEAFLESVVLCITKMPHFISCRTVCSHLSPAKDAQKSGCKWPHGLCSVGVPTLMLQLRWIIMFAGIRPTSSTGFSLCGGLPEPKLDSSGIKQHRSAYLGVFLPLDQIRTCGELLQVTNENLTEHWLYDTHFRMAAMMHWQQHWQINNTYS